MTFVRPFWWKFALFAALFVGVAGCAADPAPFSWGTTAHRAVVAPPAPAPEPPPPQPDPVVLTMPRGEETSIGAVARYIAAREPDRRRRIKALHDWVADRLEYDEKEAHVVVVTTSYPAAPGFSPTTFCRLYPNGCPANDAWGLPPLVAPTPSHVGLPNDVDLRDQLAERAFVRRRGVCAHYAALMHALGDAIGEDIVYVRGDARTRDGAVGKHAWNVAKIDDHYEPLDVTWDSGFGDGKAFHHHYSEDWLFVAPEDFVATHYPDDERWQLTKRPLPRSWFEKNANRS